MKLALILILAAALGLVAARTAAAFINRASAVMALSTESAR